MRKTQTTERLLFLVALMTFAVWMSSGAYASDLSPADFVVSPGKTYKTVVISTLQSVKADLVVPSTTVMVFQDGGTLDVVQGATLTINGSLEAPLQQIFQGSGKVKLGLGKIKEVYPQWWGARADGKSDDTLAIQSAIDSVAGGVIFFAPGAYANRGIRVKNDITLRGAGRGASSLSFTPPTGSCVILPLACSYFTVEDISIGSVAKTDGCAIDGTNEYVSHFTMRNFNIGSFRRGVYIQQGMNLSLDNGYICGPGPNVPNSVCVQFGDKALNKACTTATIKDVYMTYASTGLYNRASPCLVLRPIFETCQIGLDSYARTTVISPFMEGCSTAAARMTDNGVLFIGTSPTEHTFVYAGSAEKSRTSFIPDTFDNSMKLGPMELAPGGEFSIGSKKIFEPLKGGGK